MPKNNLKNINQAFIDCDIEIERIISSTYALAVQLLEDNDLKAGSILINIGFEKTSLGLFKNFALVHSITIPIGTNHIIKDISKVCSLSLGESTIIAKKIDFSFEDNNVLFDQNDYLKSIYFNNSNFRKISKNLIINIIQSRLNEILEIIKKQINTTKLPFSLGINLFMLDRQFTFCNLENYFSNFFSSNVKKLNNTNKKNYKEDFKDEFEACLGALKIIKDGWETEAIPRPANKHSQKNGFLSKIFGI
jgi:cell division protein FtsA